MGIRKLHDRILDTTLCGRFDFEVNDWSKQDADAIAEVKRRMLAFIYPGRGRKYITGTVETTVILRFHIGKAYAWYVRKAKMCMSGEKKAAEKERAKEMRNANKKITKRMLTISMLEGDEHNNYGIDNEATWTKEEVVVARLMNKYDTMSSDEVRRRLHCQCRRRTFGML